MTMARLKTCFVLTLAIFVREASAQTRDARPAPAVEFLAGYAGFADDATIDHAIAGTAARVYLTPRLAIGPEFVYMWGPNWDRDLFLTGNLTFDVLPPRDRRPRRVTPFLIAGGGLSQHSDRFGPSNFTSYEGAFTGGGGVRGWINDRVYAFGDVRFGWELHVRVNAGIGVSLAP
jgi:hypothetical protein